MGISLPSATGHEAVIRKAYSKAGIDDFSQTDYVEVSWHRNPCR